MDAVKAAIAVLAVATALPAAALAYPQPSLPRYGPCLGVYAAVSAISDYRFDGFSESNRSPTWQATAYCYNAKGYFVGTTLTGVDFEDTPRTHVEADWYAGRQFPVGKASVTVTLLYASFPDKRAPGPSYNLFEPEAEVSRTFQRLTVKGLAAWSTSATSRAWHLRGTLAYQLTPWLRLDTDAARYWVIGGVDHETWDVGATATWRRFTLGAHYGGETLKRDQCFYTNWCAPGPVVSLAYRVLP